MFVLSISLVGETPEGGSAGKVSPLTLSVLHRKTADLISHDPANFPLSLARNFHFDVAARSGPVHRIEHKLHMWPERRPLPSAKHDDSDFPALEILLIADVLIRCHEDFKTGRFGCREKTAISQPLPASLECLRHDMACQMLAQGRRRAMVQHHAHSLSENHAYASMGEG